MPTTHPGIGQTAISEFRCVITILVERRELIGGNTQFEIFTIKISKLESYVDEKKVSHCSRASLDINISALKK